MSDVPPDVIAKIKKAKEKNLTTLDLSRSKLIKVPKSLGQLTNLATLDLRGNQIVELTKFLGNLTNLTKLNLSNNQITKLPESLEKLTHLTEVNLWNNRIKELPESMERLTYLTKLSLRQNQITELPKSIGQLTNLTELNLWGNQIIELPESIGQLTNLATLDLRGNQIAKIPGSIGQLTNLNYLDLLHNKLTIIPDNISQIINLEIFILSNNLLSSLPNTMGELKNLRELSFPKNQIKYLPESIAKLPKLRKIALSSNPLETPPMEVCRKGIDTIKEYFQQLEQEGKDYLYEAKLLIVGEPGAGKTTLAKKIQDSDYQLQEEDSTKGIDVIQYNFPLKNGQNFRVNIWDFGGQEIYKETHQFFLTKRSLYTLVLDSRKEDDNCHYWLNIVELLTEDSPVLIIKNERQDRQKEINENALRGRFNNLKETLATNLLTKRGLPQILNKIEHYISNLDHVGDVLPKTWKRVREVLEKDHRNYISLQQYLDICQENGFKKREDKLQLSGYLHDLGVCLHFQEDPLLNKTVILKPEWGTAAVYRVLDNTTVVNNKGKFTKNDLANIWDEDEYMEMRDELLQLMVNFKLCYEIPGQKHTYIAPQLLSNNQPDYSQLWDNNNNLILRYTYEFMPKGIITQFIVVMHKDIEQQKYVWKSGVLLNKDQTKAEVIKNYDKREIKIRVFGQNKRDLMTIVTHEIDKIHNVYKRLKCSKLIPCNC